MAEDNSREIAKAIVNQWDKHDKFRVVAGEDSSEPDEVVVARALLRVDAEYGCEVRDPCGTIWQHAAKVDEANKRLRQALIDIRRSFGHKMINNDTSSLGDFIRLVLSGCEGVIAESKPFLKVLSVFGESRIEVCDGVSTATLTLKKAGVEQLIDELRTVSDLAEDEDAA